MRPKTLTDFTEEELEAKLRERQYAAEIRAVQKADVAYAARQEATVARLGSEEEREFLKRTIEPLVEAIKREQDKEAQRKSHKRHTYSLIFLLLDARVLAAITLHAIYELVMGGGSESETEPSKSALAMAIGDACHHLFLRERKEVTDQWVHRLERRLLENFAADNRHARAAVRKALKELKDEAWKLRSRAALGGFLLALAASRDASDPSRNLDLIVITLEPHEKQQGENIERVQLSPSVAQQVARIRAIEKLPVLRPTYLPMVCRPRRWCGLQGGGFLSTTEMALTENYVLNELTKHHNNRKQIEALERATQDGELEEIYTAVNALQDTAWRINRPIYEVLRYAWNNHILLPGLPDRSKLPELIAQLQPFYEAARGRWEQVREDNGKGAQRRGREPTPEEREYWTLLRETANDRAKRRELESQIKRLQRLLGVCRILSTDPTYADLGDALQLYFPYQLDYRGRVYSMVSAPNPQGSDHDRALLEFARGEPLGADGAQWLEIHLANTYGKDKEPFAKRREWVEANADTIRALAQIITARGKPNHGYIRALPEEVRAFWQQADKPWSFLAACLEWVNHNKPGFVSHLPIALDASASGLQHLSALSRDAETARATNVLPAGSSRGADERRDIYADVAEEVKSALIVIAGGSEDSDYEELNLTESEIRDPQEPGLARREKLVQKRELERREKLARRRELAQRWACCEITRKLVKQNVMTKFYGAGVLERGKQILTYMREHQELMDAFKDDAEGAARLLAGVVDKCIQQRAPGPTQVMRWLQGVADALWEFDVGLSWTTPSGYPVVHESREKSETVRFPDPKTNRNRYLRLTTQDPEKELSRRSQFTGVTPHFVHSRDAAHLVLTVAHLHRDGVTDIAVIHDSFAVHAQRVPHLRMVLKDEFVRMYRKPLQGVLEPFFAEQKKRLEARRKQEVARLEQEITSLQQEITSLQQEIARLRRAGREAAEARKAAVARKAVIEKEMRNARLRLEQAEDRRRIIMLKRNLATLDLRGFAPSDMRKSTYMFS